ncbi:MAG: hypothetical protein K2O45_05440 [Oscillospiraceae bacterium]|nr:hypothetical protein [Oscillospiraceae bacterium]
MRKKRLRNAVQDLILILLTLSALFLLARLPLLRNIRLSSQVPALFSPEPSAGSQEEEVLPGAMFPSMDLMVTGDSQYGRYGRLCVDAGDASLQQISPQFREALGSASPAGPAEDEAFRSALEGPGLYLKLTAGPLPLEAVAAWLGERVSFDQSLEAMALTIGEADSAQLYLLDGQGGIFRYDTALPASAVQALCESYSPNGAYFSYETASGGGVDPYTVLPAEQDAPPDLLAELPAGYSVYNLLTALGFNAHTLSRYTESGGAEVVEESPRTLRITPDGTVTLISRGGGVSPLYQASGQGLRETLAAAWRLASALTEGTGASPLHLQAVEGGDGGYTLRFRYQAAGFPIFFSDEADGLTVTYQSGGVTSFTYRCRSYTAQEEEPAALLPAGMAQAIAAAYPGSSLSIGYEDDGAGRLSAQWLR